MLQQIGEGVYASIRREPPGLAFDANVVFIINDSDVVVVDTNVTPSPAREVLAALRKLTSKPVKYVINTHWHDDHIIGNQVYREAFPAAEFIGHITTREDLQTIGAANRRQTIAGAPGLMSQIRELLAENKSFTGGVLTAEERESYLRDLTWGERYLAEAASFQIVMPTVTIEHGLTLQRGGRTIEVRNLGGAHTRADLIVYLPAERIAITGDLIVWPIPLIGSTSYPLDYKETLERLLGLGAGTVFVPGHGPILRDDVYLRLMIRLLESINRQVAASVLRGETLEQTRKSVNLNEFREAFAGESQLKRFIFANYVTGPGIAAAFRQASGPK